MWFVDLPFDSAWTRLEEALMTLGPLRWRRDYPRIVLASRMPMNCHRASAGKKFR
jgi:hypothetical protein